jgi:Ca2+-binding EF-hand superfamily protein
MKSRRIFFRTIAFGLVACLAESSAAGAGQADQQQAAIEMPPIYSALYYLAGIPPLGKRVKTILYPHCPEGTQKLLDILCNPPPPRMFSPGQSRFGWDWLASRFDTDGDGSITRNELPGSADWFDRLDRNQDGKLSSLDFDWSDRSPLVQKSLQASQLLSRMDSDSNGQVSPQEWAEFFARNARDKGYLTHEDLQNMFTSSRSAQSSPYNLDRQLQRLIAMYRGETSSPFGHAPDVGTLAPDFRLKTLDTKHEVRLSQFRGQRPVVLVFGSFT